MPKRTDGNQTARSYKRNPVLEPHESSPNSKLPYVWASLILFLLGIILVGMVLFLRPQLDPLLVITPVFGFIISIAAGIAAFMKSQETHLSLNGQLTAWKKEFYAMSHAEGIIVGTQNEQARVAEQKRIVALTVQSLSGTPTSQATLTPATPPLATPPPITPAPTTPVGNL